MKIITGISMKNKITLGGGFFNKKVEEKKKKAKLRALKKVKQRFKLLNW